MNLYDKLYEKFLNNKMGHAFLIETKSINLSYIKVLELCKKINCINTYNPSCSYDCNICYLIDNFELPSLITIEPDGYFIKKEQIQRIKNLFSKSSVYSKYNIYIIKQPEKMNLVAANTLLKFLEEPENNTVCFMLTSKKETVLKTIVSRCEIYKDEINELDTNEKVAMIEELIISIEESKNLKIITLAKEMLNNNKDELLSLFQKIYIIYYMSLKECDNSINKNNKISKLITAKNTKQSILDKLSIIRKTFDNLTYNVNIELLLNKFLIEMMNEVKI